MSESEKLDLKKLVGRGVDKALEFQFPLAATTVSRLRRVHPDKSPKELVSYLTNVYIGAVATTGAGAGAAAIVPNGAGQVGIAILDLGTFLEASVFYTLAVAEVHGLHVEDLERRKALVSFALLGNSAAAAVIDTLIDQSVPYWGKKLVQAIPIEVVRRINKIMGPQFLAKWTSKQGALILGKQVPLFVGMGIGAAGNALFARAIAGATKKMLGPAPAQWTDAPASPADIEVTVISETPSGEESPTKRPAAKKPTAKKPVARKPKPSA
jgi:hypothetical protein